MSFWRRLFTPREPSVDVIASVKTVTPEQPDPKVLEQAKALGLRPDMWVMTEFGVGILQGFLDDNLVVMLVKPDGTNRELIAAASCRQASWDDVPEPRKHISDSQAAALGYTRR